MSMQLPQMTHGMAGGQGDTEGYNRAGDMQRESEERERASYDNLANWTFEGPQGETTGNGDKV